jgi:hypothetical protein
MTELTLNETLLSQLRAPVRNRYFYGKLLDVRHLEMEQAYEITQRWLVNRLGLGTGVLCGLELELAEPGLFVRPGVAIDGLGREIVVPASYCITDPTQPTDDAGRPAGDKVVDGAVTVYLCYTECPDDPTPVLVGDCDTRNGFAPGSTVARFKMVLRSGPPDRERSGLTDAQCAGLFPSDGRDAHDLAAAACQVLTTPCVPPDDPCIVLGKVLVDPAGKATGVEMCNTRTTVYSNARLFDLLACFAETLVGCCAVAELRYVAGDAQQGATGQTLPISLEVTVVDHAGNPIDGTDVNFNVQAGDGQLSDGTTSGRRVVVRSSRDGHASVTLALGANPGPGSVEAVIENGSRVVFTAWGIS